MALARKGVARLVRLAENGGGVMLDRARIVVD